MKQFFKMVLATIVGLVVGTVLIGLLVFILIAGLIAGSAAKFSQADEVYSPKSNSVYHIVLDRPIVDRGPDQQFNFNFGPFQVDQPLGLNHLLADIRKAESDTTIQGIFLELEMPLMGYASAKELRDALVSFRESGKWIVSYAENYSQKALYLASAGSEIYMVPEGNIMLNGLSAQITFLKGTLDKLGIEAQIIRGANNKFKSAVEPLMGTEMSEANREQTRQYINALWSELSGSIAQGRSVPRERIEALASDYALRVPSDAVDAQIITGLRYRDEVLDLLMAKTEAESEDELNLVAVKKYRKAPEPRVESEETSITDRLRRDKIAVIYASGDIVSGEGSDEQIGSETLSDAIKQARQDSSVKAIVLRVNSPGGSALASDVIWRETKLARETKPVVVSMGDLAASGGYYIAANANRIYANPTTLTGSIGVFGVIPNMEELFTDKMGLTFDGVKTSEFADLGSLNRPLTEEEYAIFQDFVEHTYSTFVGRVSDGRGKPIAYVDSIGQGRVWIGADALKLGLVDELGGLYDAIDGAAELAAISDYRLVEYPIRKDPFEEFMADLQAQSKVSMARWVLGDGYAEALEMAKTVQSLHQQTGVQAAMPFRILVK